MDMDSMQATIRGDIRDLRRRTVSPTDLQTGFANFVQDMELQLSQQNRSAVEQAQAVRNVQAQFNSLHVLIEVVNVGRYDPTDVHREVG